MYSGYSQVHTRLLSKVNKPTKSNQATVEEAIPLEKILIQLKDAYQVSFNHNIDQVKGKSLPLSQVKLATEKKRKPG